MKKLISIILSLALVASLVAVFASCGQSKSLDAAYNKYIAEYEFDDEGLEELVVATSPDFAPMEFVDLAKTGTDQYVGFDIILAKYIAKELNMKLVITPMSFDACMVAVQTGAADLAISGFSWTADRAENFEITDWYEAGKNETEQILITTAENENKLTTSADCSGLTIGAQGGSLQELLVNEQLVTAGAKIQLYQDLGTAAEALKTGKIDALAVAAGNGEAIIQQSEGALALAGFNFEVDDLYKNNVVLIQKGNTELLEKVNDALAKAKEANLYDPWYEACQIYAEVKTADELGYDAEGNKITE